MKCRICHHEINAFMSFGQMPLANAFLNKKEFSNEYFYNLEPAFCEQCHTFQLTEQPDPRAMFHENYAFFSRTSNYMITHFQQFSHWVMTHYLHNKQPFVMEIGSNDGILLENFARQGIQHLGIEPSANVAEVARQHGVNTECQFFNDEVAQQVQQQYGHADAILAANVMCHIPDLHAIGQAVNRLLTPKGVFIFEDPYLGDVLDKTAYDQIYDEHVYLFSAHAVSHIFQPYGLELINLQYQTTHGGSMRYVLARNKQYDIDSSVTKQLTYEQTQGLHKMATYEQFRKNCEHSRDTFTDTLYKKKQQGQQIAGYAATSKSTTVLNYCQIKSDLINFISDTTTIKQGKFSPGMHIPIYPYETFKENYPDTAVLFAWNHKQEIMAKESEFAQQGGQWLTHVDL